MVRNLEFQLRIVIQEKAEGAGQAILLTKKHIEGDFLLLNSYHVEIDKLLDSMLSAKTKENDLVLLVKQRKNTSNYGVLKVNGKKVEAIIEKPKPGEEPSNLCIVGVYLLSLSFLTTLSKVPSEHYQLERALNLHAKNNNVEYVETEEETVVLKYPWDLLEIKNYLMKNLKTYKGKNVKIAENVQIQGEAYIEDDVTILEGVTLKGPVYLGKGVLVGSNALLRTGVDLEASSVAGSYMEIKNSLIMEKATTHSGFIGDSIVGEGTKIGAQFCTANVRLDRANVISEIRGEKVDTGYRHLGVAIGRASRVGLKVSTMPGIIIGSNVVIGPATIVLQNVADNKKYYTKFQEIINE